MDQSKVDLYMYTNHKFFPEDRMMYLRDRLLAVDDNKFMWVSTLELKDPTTFLLISIFLGYLGVDRFMLGDIGMGVLKLLTGGLCGILTIIDWVTIMGKTKEMNFQKLMGFLAS